MLCDKKFYCAPVALVAALTAILDPLSFPANAVLHQ